MVKDKEIQHLVRTLNINFNKQKELYENTKQAIQDTCSHNELIELQNGRTCNICGRFFPYDYRINKIVKKEYVEKNYWDKALGVCKEFAVKVGVPSEDISKALIEIKNKYEGDTGEEIPHSPNIVFGLTDKEMQALINTIRNGPLEPTDKESAKIILKDCISKYNKNLKKSPKE